MNTETHFRLDLDGKGEQYLKLREFARSMQLIIDIE